MNKITFINVWQGKLTELGGVTSNQFNLTPPRVGEYIQVVSGSRTTVVEVTQVVHSYVDKCCIVYTNSPFAERLA